MPRKEAAKKWDKENMTVLSCRVTKEKAMLFRKCCDQRETNVNAVLLAYVNKYIKMCEGQDLT